MKMSIHTTTQRPSAKAKKNYCNDWSASVGKNGGSQIPSKQDLNLVEQLGSQDIVCLLRTSTSSAPPPSSVKVSVAKGKLSSASKKQERHSTAQYRVASGLVGTFGQKDTEKGNQ